MEMANFSFGRHLKTFTLWRDLNLFFETFNFEANGKCQVAIFAAGETITWREKMLARLKFFRSTISLL